MSDSRSKATEIKLIYKDYRSVVHAVRQTRVNDFFDVLCLNTPIVFLILEDLAPCLHGIIWY